MGSMKRTVEVDPKIRAAFEAKVAECITIARQKSGKEIPMFPVVFRQCGSQAGLCQVSMIKPVVLYINPDFFKKYYDDQLNNTTPHEVAHGVAHVLWPEELISFRRREWHGDKWRTVMNWFGITNPETTHFYDLTGVTMKTERPFKYRCRCDTLHELSLMLHTRIQAKGKKRICRNCRGILVYVKSPQTPMINIQIKRVTPKVTVVTVIPKPKPMAPATHRTVTTFVNGTLQNIRIPLTPEEIAV